MPTSRNANFLKQQEAKQQRQRDYDLYRTRMEHEDGLIGQRLGWLVSSQAFLLTPFVLTYLKAVDVSTAKSPFLIKFNVPAFLFSLNFVDFIIVLIGLVSCAITIRGTTAAIRSKVDMTYDFLERYEPDNSFEPGVGLRRKEGVHGVSAPRYLPLAFAVMWCALAPLSLQTLRLFHGSQYPFWPYVVVGISSLLVFYVFYLLIGEAHYTEKWNKKTKKLHLPIPPATGAK